MANFDLEIPMPEPYRKFLMEIIKEAKCQKRLSFTGSSNAGEVSAKIYGDAGYHRQIDLPPGDSTKPFHAFCVFDLLVNEPFPEGTFYHGVFEFYYLTPKAFHWYEYEKKGRVGKFFARLWANLKDVMLGIAFILSLILTALQIMQLSRGLP